MKRGNKYKPYLKRGNGREKSEDYRMCIRLAYFRTLKRPYYIMAQRGFPNLAMQVEASKQEIKRHILAVRLGWKTFSEWANTIKRHANPKRQSRNRSEASSVETRDTR